MCFRENRPTSWWLGPSKEQMRVLTLLLAAPWPVFGQIAFEVASIKPAPPQELGRTSVRRSTDKARLNYMNVSLMDLVTDAYRVQPREVVGPDWLDSVRYDVLAKLPEGAKGDQIPEMLQSLLVERFGLKAHQDSKEMSMYALIVGKGGSKMKKAEKAGGMGSNSKNGRVHMTVKATMDDFAKNLSGRLDRPVVDQTGLEGAWEFELDYLTDGAENAAAEALPTIYTAMQDQLGLKLNPTKGAVRMVVVDHIDKVPAEN